MPGQASRENGKKGGRPAGVPTQATITKEMARERLRQIVNAHMDEMVAAQVSAAKGLTVAVMRRPDGTFRRIESAEDFDKAIDSGARVDLHTLAPSTAAFTDLLNRALDKPKEQEQDVKVTGTLKVIWDDGD